MRDLDHYDRALDLVKSAKQRFVEDLEAMSHEQLAFRQGKARTAYDFTAEVAEVNRQMSKRIAGGEPEFADMEGWFVAPPELHEKAACIKNLADSCDTVVQAIEARGREGVLEELATPRGPSSPYEVASFLALHTMYHAAQLNYIQALHGDLEMHWTG